MRSNDRKWRDLYSLKSQKLGRSCFVLSCAVLPDSQVGHEPKQHCLVLLAHWRCMGFVSREPGPAATYLNCDAEESLDESELPHLAGALEVALRVVHFAIFVCNSEEEYRQVYGLSYHSHKKARQSVHLLLASK